MRGFVCGAFAFVAAEAVRSTSHLENCALRAQSLRVSYSEPGTNHNGEFDFIHIASWNGLKLASKFYGELGECQVDYSVMCKGTSVYLNVEDSCKERSDTRSFTMGMSRQTELHKAGESLLPSLSHPLRRARDMNLKVYLPRRTVRLFTEGSKVVFQLISTPTLQEQLEDPTKMIFFARVPKLASCLPQRRDRLFQSNLHNGSYSAQQCAACHNLLESKMKDLDECSVAETKEARLRCKWLSYELRQEQPGSSGADISDLILRSLHSESEEALPLPLAWQLGCQDLGCCPLDPEQAKMLASEAQQSLAMEKQVASRRSESQADVASTRQQGLAEKVLSDPSSRRKMETMLRMHVPVPKRVSQYKHAKPTASIYLRPPFTAPFNPREMERVPTSDDNCSYSFRKGRCEPRGACAYKFRLGDLTLDQSCRLRVKTLKPTSDGECLWDFKEARCRHPMYCSRQCKLLKDLTLDQCCKLRPVDDMTTKRRESPSGTEEEDDDIGLVADEDALDIDTILDDFDGIDWEGEEDPEGTQALSDDEETSESNAGEEDVAEGNCQSSSDRAVMLRPDTKAKLEKIGRKSYSVIYGLDREGSHKKHMEYGYSELCASCMVDVSDCGLKNCFKLLATRGPDHTSSIDCMEENCNPALRSCSGLTAAELPPAR
ncbi:unnamed protein product [Effrenium voratum]|nr:unnamed protein product [Effrenium voratum]